jgi:hypothetical protein
MNKVSSATNNNHGNQRGAVTDHHVQSITPVSLSTRSARKEMNKPPKK